jgi:hypothetical protein
MQAVRTGGASGRRTSRSSTFWSPSTPRRPSAIAEHLTLPAAGGARRGTACHRTAPCGIQRSRQVVRCPPNTQSPPRSTCRGRHTAESSRLAERELQCAIPGTLPWLVLEALEEGCCAGSRADRAPPSFPGTGLTLTAYALRRAHGFGRSMRSADLVALARTPFYRERLAALEGRELARLPLTRRDELQRDQLAHLPLGTRRRTAGHRRSGSGSRAGGGSSRARVIRGRRKARDRSFRPQRAVALVQRAARTGPTWTRDVFQPSTRPASLALCRTPPIAA